MLMLMDARRCHGCFSLDFCQTSLTGSLKTKLRPITGNVASARLPSLTKTAKIVTELVLLISSTWHGVFAFGGRVQESKIYKLNTCGSLSSSGAAIKVQYYSDRTVKISASVILSLNANRCSPERRKQARALKAEPNKSSSTIRRLYYSSRTDYHI